MLARLPRERRAAPRPFARTRQTPGADERGRAKRGARRRFPALRARPQSPPAPVGERRGSDLTPLDPSREEGELTLLSFVWADQTARLAALRGAIEVARRVPAAVEAADAPRWLEARLRDLQAGAATVVFHSIMWQYMSESEQNRVVE